MADTSRARTGKFIQVLFKYLIEHPDGASAKQALDHISSVVPLTEYELGEYESGGGRRFEKIVRFATVDCVKAGWMQKERGTWFITSDGITAFNKYRDPEAFYKEAARLYRVWKVGQASHDTANQKEDEAEESSNRQTSITFEEADEQALAEISDHLGNLAPYEFQNLVASLLEAMGYHVSWNAPPGKDGGVDIIAHTDVLGTKPPRIKVQVKRRNDRIDTDGVRAFLALVNEDDVGLYVALGGFTRDAEDFARNQERRKIRLIDLDRLLKLWIEHYSGLSDSARKRLPLTPIYFLTPDD